MRLKYVGIVAVCLLLVGMAIWMRRPAVKPSQYDITDLGTLGGSESHACAINNSGQIVGHSDANFGDHAFIWDNGTMTDLEGLPDAYTHQPNGSVESNAFSINDNGEVVGDADLNLGGGTARGIYDAVSWINGKPIDLGSVPGYRCSTARIVNNQGQIAGLGIEENIGFGTDNYRAGSVWFEHGLTHPTGALPNGFTINNVGQSLGSISRNGRQYLVLWKNGHVEFKTVLPSGKHLLYSALNVKGQAVVDLTDSKYEDPTTALLLPLQADRWEKGKLHPLAAIPGYPNAYATDINDTCQIVGFALPAFSWKTKGPSRTRAVLWEGTAAQDLNHLIPQGSGWTLEEATGINDHGQICGYGKHNGNERAFLLTPTGTPKSRKR